MLGVAIDADVMERSIDAPRLLALLRELRVPHVVVERRETPMEFLVAALDLPPDRIYFLGADSARVAAAAAARMRTLHVTSIEEALPQLGEAYTRSALNLRYLFRTVLEWRPGHFRD